MPAEEELLNEIRREKRKTDIVSHIALELNKPVSLKEKLNHILYLLDTIFGLKHTMLLLPDGDDLVVFASRGFENHGLGSSIKIGLGVIGIVAERKQKLRVNSISRKMKYMKASLPDDANPLLLPGLPDVESQVAIPLLAGDELIAVLSAESADLNFFSPDDENFLMTLSQIIGLSIQHTQILESLETTVKERTLSLEAQKQKLEQANAGKDRLFSIIAHDLRSPAASLQSASDLLNHFIKAGDTEKLLLTGDRVAQTAQSLSAMLDKLLNWSLTQTGEIRIKKQDFDLLAIIKEVLDAHRDAMLHKNITHKLDSSVQSLSICSDPNACFSILHNVVSNAVKFSHADSKIDIEVTKEDQFIIVSVRDHGTGMPFEKVKNILSSSVNPSARGTANEKGTGIGLAISIDLARRINSMVTVDSKPGEGTTVRIKLPL